ncbi:hypothetical protein V493_06341, partial [Pseudogymnoascus sp. VKM F-4281 (FW-2241)]
GGLSLKDRANSQPVNASPLRLFLASVLRLLSRKVLQLLLINARLPAVQVGRLGTHTLALHDELVSKDHTEVQRDAQVRSDEVLVVPLAVRVLPVVLGNEVVEALEDGDQAAEAETDVRAPESAGGDKGQGAVGDVLGAAGAHKVDVRHENRDPGEETEDGDEVDKVLEDRHGGGVDAEEGEEAEARGETERVDGDTAAIGARKDLGGVALDCESVEGSRRDVEI